jgi:hypothetical protein
MPCCRRHYRHRFDEDGNEENLCRTFSLEIEFLPDDRRAKVLTLMKDLLPDLTDEKSLTFDFPSGQKAAVLRRKIERMRLRGVKLRVVRHEEY